MVRRTPMAGHPRGRDETRPDAQPSVVASDEAAWEAQSISGEGATPKTTVAAPQSRAEPAISGQRPVPLVLVADPPAPATGLVVPATCSERASPGASGDAPAIAGIAGVAVGSGLIQTAATTRR